MVALGLVATAACPAIAQPVFLEKQALLCTTVAAVQAPIDVEPPTVTAGQQRPMVLTAISGTGRRGRCFWGPTGISLMIVGGEGDLSLVRVTRQRDALFVRSSALQGLNTRLIPLGDPQAANFLTASRSMDECWSTAHSRAIRFNSANGR